MSVFGVVKITGIHVDVQTGCEFHVIRGKSGNLLSF